MLVLRGIYLELGRAGVALPGFLLPLLDVVSGLALEAAIEDMTR